MSIAIDATSGGTSTGATSTTYSHTCTGNNRVLLVSVGSGDNTVTGVTYNGVAMSLLGSRATGAGSSVVYLYGLIAPSTGANNVVISRSGSLGVLNGASSSYTSVAQTGLPDAESDNQANTNSLATSLNTIADNCWTVLAGYASGGGNIAAGTGSTSRNIQSTTTGIFDSNGVIHPAGSTSMTITMTSGNTATVMVSIAPFVISFSITETVTLTEAKTVVKGKLFTILETLSLTETMSAIRKKVFTILETMSLTDLFHYGAIWINQTFSTSSWSDDSKHSSSFTNGSKSTSTWVDKNKD